MSVGAEALRLHPQHRAYHDVILIATTVMSS
jgi:hypothetical protein